MLCLLFASYIILSNKIFNSLFQSRKEKIPKLAVPLINEIFGTSYQEDIEIIQRRNEHQTKQGEIITDSQLLIAEKIYHLECQSTQDSEMVVRMIEYDFSIGLETMEKEEILEKRLFFLLPFYIMRYEKMDLETGNQKLSGMLEEDREIEKRLEKEFLEKGKEKEYRDLIELIIRIADYILRKRKKARKGFDDVMGGKVLELESDRLMQQGRTEVIQIIKLLKQGLTVGETARKLQLPEEEVQQIWEETEC